MMQLNVENNDPGVIGVAEELRDLQCGRHITEHGQPMESYVGLPNQFASEREIMEDYENEVKEFWDNGWALLEIASTLPGEFLFESELVQDEFGDQWDGRPNYYVTEAEILEVCKAYGVTVEEYLEYYNLSYSERKAYRARNHVDTRGVFGPPI